VIPQWYLAQNFASAIDRARTPNDMLAALLLLSSQLFQGIRAADAARHDSSHAAAAAADDFMPVLSFVVLKANPKKLASALTIIAEWRDQDQLAGQQGYYYVSFCVAVSFLLNSCVKTSGLTEQQVVELRQQAQHQHRWKSVIELTKASKTINDDGNEDSDLGDEWVLLEHKLGDAH